MTAATRLRNLGGRTGEAAALVAIDDVDADGTVVRGDGALLRYLELTSLNPWVLDEQACDDVMRGARRTLDRLPAGAKLQFVAEAQPLRLAEMEGRTRSRTVEAIRACARSRYEAYWMARLQLAREETFEMHASDDGAVSHRYYVVVPYLPRRRAKRRQTVREHHRAVRDLQARCDMLRGELQSMGIASRQLDGAEALGLLWSSANPTVASRQGTPTDRARALAGEAIAPRHADQAAARAAELRSFVSASEVRETARTVRIGDDEHLTLAVARKPEAVTFGWMLPATQAGKPFRFVAHIEALDARKEARRLRRELRLNWGAQRSAQVKGSVPDFENAGLQQELLAIAQRLTSGRVGFFDVSLYLQLREPAPAEDTEDLLHAAQRAGDDLTVASNCEVTFGIDHQLPLARSVMPLGENVAALNPLGQKVPGLVGRYTGDQIGALLPVLGAECGSPDGIPMFFTAGRGLSNLDPLDPEALNYILTVVGAQGSGKTMFVQALLQGLLAWGMRGYVIDRADHFLPLVQLVGGAHLKLGAGANQHRISPWDVADVGEVPDEHVEFLLALIGALIGRKDRAAEALETIEQGLLTTAIRDVYRDAAERPSDPSVRPRALGLQHALGRRAGAEREAGRHGNAEVAENLAARMEQYVGGGTRAWLLDDETTLPEGGVPLVLFDTRDVPEALQGPVSLILTRHIAAEAKRRHDRLSSEEAQELKRRFVALGLPTRWVEWFFTTFVAYDECWSQLEREEVGDRFNAVARQSRHINLVMICSTQRLQDFDTRAGRALLSSATVQLYLAQRARDFPILTELAGMTAHELELIRLHVATSVGRESRAYLINGSRGRGVVSLRLGPTSYWAATSHPNERPRRDRALRLVGGTDMWSAIDTVLGRLSQPMRWDDAPSDGG